MFLHWIIKQAFLLFYLRLSPQRGFQIAVYITMGINASFTIINWMLGFLQCRPLDAMIHPEAYPDAQCLNQYAVMMVPTALVCFLLNGSFLFNILLIMIATSECRFGYYYPYSSNPDSIEAPNESETKGRCYWSYWFWLPVRRHGNVPLLPAGSDGGESRYNIRLRPYAYSRFYRD